MRLLMIEDDTQKMFVVRKHLAGNSQWEMFWAANVHEAKLQLNAGLYDLIIWDNNLGCGHEEVLDLVLWMVNEGLHKDAYHISYEKNIISNHLVNYGYKVIAPITSLSYLIKEVQNEKVAL